MSKLDIKLTLEKLQHDLEEAMQEAYIDGFNAGSSADKPTQEEFNKSHHEPLGYGEDGEIYVMSGALSENQALHKLKTLFTKEMMFDDYDDLGENLRLTKIAYIPEEISSEPGYYFRRDSSGVYDAWVWTA
jgi:hypothetical protein